MFRSCSRLKVDFADTSVSQLPSPRTQAKHKKTISSGVGIGFEEEEMQVVEDPAVVAAEEKKASLYDTDQTKTHMRSFYIEKLTPRKQIIDGFYQPHDARFHPFNVFPQILSQNTKLSHKIEFGKYSRRGELWNTGFNIAYDQTISPKKKTDLTPSHQNYIASLIN